ncbi:hypothetical protein GCM10027589_35700 [Actinocorallia lasiicapitis]
MDARMPRRYLPDDDPAITGEGVPDQIHGTPRPAHGTIWYGVAELADDPDTATWEATWVDDFPTPDTTGATTGITRYEGPKTKVLAWVAAQPAADKVHQNDR